jgi:hypothetical protein
VFRQNSIFLSATNLGCKDDVVDDDLGETRKFALCAQRKIYVIGFSDEFFDFLKQNK